MKFWKIVFGSALGFIVAQIVLTIFAFFIIAMIIGGIGGKFDSKKAPKLTDKSVLHVKLDRPIHDREPKIPFSQGLGPLLGEREVGLNDILDNIEKAKDDDRIKGIYLDLSFIPAQAATIEEIRNALLDFKTSGKFIVSYSESYTQSAYYLATVADEIYLNPYGFIFWRGLAANLSFFKGTLEKLHVEPVIFRPEGNKFKSAVEPFIRKDMSDASKKQMRVLLNAIWKHRLEGIEKQRGISISQLQNYADSLTIRTAYDALKYKFVDGLFYKDELLKDIRAKIALEEDKEINFVSIDKYTYANGSGNDENASGKYKKGKIAVVYATGAIESGRGDDLTIGSERISKAIRDAREDSTVLAIVLRVNSPGGSALASEVIWREMVLAEKVKPVVVSMGDYAASGGYYISAPADTIVASPSTITGSIGVFGLLFNMGDMFNDHLGISFDTVKTNKFSDLGIGSLTRELTEYEKEVIQQGVDSIYREFLEKVAEGRGVTVEYVDSIAQGRVWSGTDAVELGLADMIGGMETAIKVAAEMANLEDYRVIELPKQKDPFDQLLKELNNDLEKRMLNDRLGTAAKYLEQLKSISGQAGIQARLPFEVVIE